MANKMKVQVKRDDFFYLISQAYGLIEKRNILPILSKTLVFANENTISIQATDQDNSIKSQVSATVEKPGQAVLDAQNLYDIVKELPSGEDISISGQTGQKIKIEQGSSVFHLLSVDVQDFPAFPPFQMKDMFKIKADILKNFIEKTAFCASIDETQYHLTGVFFEVSKPITQEKKEDKLFFRFVATDGHRLGLAETPCSKSPLEKGVIISKKGVQEIKKLVSYTEGVGKEDVEVALNAPRILFRYGETVLSVKLVEGAYPNYTPLVPKASAVSLVLNRERFQHTLRRVSLLSSNRFKGVNFQVKKNKIQMETENPELGSAKDEVPCTRKKGEDLIVRFNARYMLDALSSLSSEKALVEFGGKEKPCVMRPLSKEKEEPENSLCVVMPMKI